MSATETGSADQTVTREELTVLSEAILELKDAIGNPTHTQAAAAAVLEAEGLHPKDAASAAAGMERPAIDALARAADHEADPERPGFTLHDVLRERIHGLDDHQADLVTEFRAASNQAYMATKCLDQFGQRRGTTPGAKPIQPQQLKGWHRLQWLARQVRKELNTSDDTDFVPEEYGSVLIDEKRLPRRVASQFEQITVPRSPFRLPVAGAIGLPYLIGEPTTDTGEKIATRDPALAKVTFDCVNIGLRIVYSEEFAEDSIVTVEDYVRRNLARSLENGVETGIMNGDTDSPHRDTVVTESNDVRHAWNGLRKLASDGSAEVDISTFSQATIVNVMKLLGVEYAGIDELVWVIPPAVRNKIIGDATNFPNFNAYNLLGQAAPNVTGQLPQLYGIPVVESVYVPITCANAATDAGTGDDAVMVLANKRCYGLGTQRGAQMNLIWNAETLQFVLVAYLRADFQPYFAAASNLACAVGYNIDVS